LNCLRKRLAKPFAAPRPNDGGHARAGRWSCFSASCDAIERKRADPEHLQRANQMASLCVVLGAFGLRCFQRRRERKWESGLKLNRARGSAAMDQAARRG